VLPDLLVCRPEYAERVLATLKDSLPRTPTPPSSFSGEG